MEKNVNYLFDMQQSCTSKQSEPCTLSSFNKAINSSRTAVICRLIKRVIDGSEVSSEELEEVGIKEQFFSPFKKEDKIAILKKKLPAFCFLARFNGGARKAENATPTGLAFLDLDHIGDATAAWDKLKEKAVQNGCILAHVTPSGEGLRIVFKRPSYLNVETAMYQFADKIGAKDVLGNGKLDTCVKDLARCSFAVPADYILYRDDEQLFNREVSEVSEVSKVSEVSEEQEADDSETVAENVADVANVANVAEPIESSYPTTYRGIPYNDIICKLLENDGFKLVNGCPVVGDRHNALKAVLPVLRHACDLDAKFIKAVLPDWGLPEHEVQALINSNVNYEHGKSSFPRKLQKALSELEKEYVCNEQLMDAETEVDEQYPLPAKMPASIARILDAYPDDYKPAALVAMMPALGTLATRVRSPYIDNVPHSMTFLSCVTSPQAGGKSGVKRLVDMLLGTLKAYDFIEMEKQRKYEEELKRSKNSDTQPDDPHACIRCIPEKTSNTSLSLLLDNARGQHLIQVTPEIDSMAKCNKNAWSSMDDILRKAYDNDSIGQYYMSGNSHKSNAAAFINVMMTGTPSAMYSYLNNVEGGLVSRFCFAQLPDSYGRCVETMGNFSPDVYELIMKDVDMLMREGESEDYAKSCGGVFQRSKKPAIGDDGRLHYVDDDDKVPTVTYTLPQLQKAMTDWQNLKAYECQKERNNALDTFRRRAGVMGFRAGVIFFILEGHKETDEAIALAKWFADYCLDQQMRLFGGALNASIERSALKIYESGVRMTRNNKFFDALPDAFGYDIMREVAQKRGEKCNENTLRSHVNRWKNNGLIKEVSRGHYEKNPVLILQHPETPKQSA